MTDGSFYHVQICETSDNNAKSIDVLILLFPIASETTMLFDEFDFSEKRIFLLTQS